ncbi:MAG: class I SAM-dependent methyltransferase [Candidatus Magasanikbacteria bacterium]
MKENKFWGKTDKQGSEIWDTDPVFKGDIVTWKDKLKLLFYPKKFFLYRHIYKDAKKKLRKRDLNEPYRILDVGCGTGASIIDLKKLLGKRVDVVGVDVVGLQIDLAKEKIKKNAVYAEVELYDGDNLPFADGSFDAIYSSDVLGHVENVRNWLDELNRVLKPGGVLAMFSESKLGKHAYIRNYLFKRGLNIDPHAEYHISLYSKYTLKEFLESSGFEIKKMYTAFWASFILHPDEFHESFTNTHKFFILKAVNKILYLLKKKTHPYSTALCELYGLVEMLVVGKWVEAQGYVVLGRKRCK